MWPFWVDLVHYQRKLVMQIVGLKVRAQFFDNIRDGASNVTVEFCLSQPQLKIIRRPHHMYGVESFDSVIVGRFVIDFRYGRKRVKHLPNCQVKTYFSKLSAVTELL